jgi:hypothetical protein
MATPNFSNILIELYLQNFVLYQFRKQVNLINQIRLIKRETNQGVVIRESSLFVAAPKKELQ